MLIGYSLLWLILLIVGQDQCIDDIDDVQQNGVSNYINPDRTVIIPRLKFTCNGRITNIRAGMSSIKDSGSDFPYIQIWRPSPPSQLYSLVDKVQIQSSHSDLEASISIADSTSMHFLSGDVIGYHNPPNSGIVIRDTASTDDFVLYVFGGSDTSQKDLNTGTTFTRRKPLIQFTLGECRLLLCVMR